MRCYVHLYGGEQETPCQVLQRSPVRPFEMYGNCAIFSIWVVLVGNPLQHHNMFVHLCVCDLPDLLAVSIATCVCVG